MEKKKAKNKKIKKIKKRKIRNEQTYHGIRSDRLY